LTTESSYEERRKHLSTMSDQELKKRFWELAENIVRPMYDMAYKYTSPSVERSVLLRMGFSSVQAQGLVANAVRYGLLRKGAGHLVLRYGEIKNMDYLDAGAKLAEGQGWDELAASFGGEKK
jgi:D-ornithine 4,5-aminomutase subunit alpha